MQVVCLGDHAGLSEQELSMVRRVGATAGGGGPVLAASLGPGMLLGSHCIVILHHYLDLIHTCPPRLWAPPSLEARRSGRQRRRHAQRKEKKAAAAAVAAAVGVEGGADPHTAAENTNTGPPQKHS